MQGQSETRCSRNCGGTPPDGCVSEKWLEKRYRGNVAKGDWLKMCIEREQGGLYSLQTLSRTLSNALSVKSHHT